MSASLVARNITKSFGPRVVLDRVSCTVGPQHRVGVVAPNGTGKSTLLKILAGLEPPDAGTVTRTPPTATVGYLPQEPERRAGETVRAYLGRRTGVAAAETRARRARRRALGRRRSRAPTTRTPHALDAFLALGAADFDARVGDGRAPTSACRPRPRSRDDARSSGGQAARASLAAILLARFDVFLLDEPTNDLDFAGLDRLEQFLRDELTGGAVIVSHDRAFLDRTITSVLELDEHSHTRDRVRGRLAGVPRRAGDRAPPRRRGLRRRTSRSAAS